MRKITIKINDLKIKAELFNTPTANRVFDALPLMGDAQIWREEIYFMIPLELGLEHTAREEVEIGDLGYWPDGPAFCVFFGQTPVSQTDKPKAYSPVNVFGHISQDMSPLKTVTSGSTIIVEKASS